jgi:hypothetical protein
MQKFLSDITDAEYKEVERLAALFFTPKEIAKMLEFGNDFIVDCDKINSKSYNCFQGGMLQGEIDLRTGIMKMAKAGSSQAQTMALDILTKTKLKMKAR